MSNGQYRLEAFGIQSTWNLWRIRQGGLDEPETERATPYERALSRRLYESDFGSTEDLRLALRIFPKLRDDLDRRQRTRMEPKPPIYIAQQEEQAS